MTVQLAPLPDIRPTRIVCGTTVRKAAPVLRFYLQSLAWQRLPKGVELIQCFVDDSTDAESSDILHQWAANHGGTVLRTETYNANDFTDVHPDSHQWSVSAMQRVGAAKNRILAHARAIDADYVWFADADLICDPMTLASLLSCETDIATAVYWTRWSQRGTETRKVHAAPQVWLKHPYTLEGNGMAEWEFRERLAKRQLTPVAGYGACTLINRRALEAGVSFAPVPGVPMEGLMAGEDRHFCIRAQQLHLSAVADPWPDIFHIYHLPVDLQRAPEYAARLNRPSLADAEHSDVSVQIGDLVNLTLQAVEPIPWGGGGWTAIPPQRIRGRLGALALMPELEEAIYDLSVGESRIVPVHFPVHYEVPAYRGQRRLIRVTLHDAKPFGFAPVLEDEMLMGARSCAAIRTVDFNTRQLEGMREVANG
jgi:hypothetical protein